MTKVVDFSTAIKRKRKEVEDPINADSILLRMIRRRIGELCCQFNCEEYATCDDRSDWCWIYEDE